MLAIPMEIDDSPRKMHLHNTQKKHNVTSKWKNSYITPVSKKGTNIELLNQHYVTDSSNSDSLYSHIFISRTLMASLPKYNEISQPYSSIHLAKKTRRSCNLTLVLDLDETLIHTSNNPNDLHDFKISFQERNGYSEVFINMRPFVKEFIETVGKHFEVVLFTAAEVTSTSNS